MSRAWHLGGRRYAPVLELGSGAGDRSWRILRDEGDGSRWLMQHWRPCPPDRELDRIREVYLQHITGAEAIDPPLSCFGFDETQAWFLQRLVDPPLAELWPRWSPALRQVFLARLRRDLGRTLHPRLLHPEALGLKPGRILLPRVIGGAPWAWEDLERLLQAAPGDQDGPRPWEAAPELSGTTPLPVRGRAQELTYLKSLMLGLARREPMERIVVLLGEQGMGLGRMALWATAVAETEAIWVREFEVQPGERAGAFLARLLQGLLEGIEAELYTQRPEAARTLARRLPCFAFLRGGLRPAIEAPLEPAEVHAALAVLAFLAEIHPRLVQVQRVERADRELQALLAELAASSTLAWFFSVALSGPGHQAKVLMGPLHDHPSAAFVHLNRLEDHDLLDSLDDLMHPGRLGQAFRGEVCQASLGNPGLMRSLLENAQQEGLLEWDPEWGWKLTQDPPGPLRTQEDLAGKVLAGRLQRIGPASLAVLRLAAVADRPLDVHVLGSALGIAGDPLEEALRVAVDAKLLLVKDGVARLAGGRVRELALQGMVESELRRSARSLLKALGDEAGLFLAIHLESLASEPQGALARLMALIEQGPVAPPEEAEPVVHRALELGPSAVQAARLWEFLADAWCLARRPSCDSALAAMAKAQAILEAEAAPGRARLYRKEAFLRLRSREVGAASRAIHAAAACLVDQPTHPEQALLRLALGRVHLAEGFTLKGMKALEEGLALATGEPSPLPPRDQVPLLLELGRVRLLRCQFQRALGTLQSARRLVEHGQDLPLLVQVLLELAGVHQALGQGDQAYGLLREALQVARIQDDLSLLAQAHLALGIFQGRRQALVASLSHLDSALERFEELQDRPSVATAKAWKARSLAALGDAARSDMLLLQALDRPQGQLSAQEAGDLDFLQGEVASFRGGWRDAARLFKEACRKYEGAGLLWGERLARLKLLQSLARGRENLDKAWGLLEQQKALVEGTGSRWLDLEWHRAHVLLLDTLEPTAETVAVDALGTLSSMLAAARELGWPAEELEASALGAEALMRRGESLGARSRLQEAASAFQRLWTEVPESLGLAFLGRPDIHAFREATTRAGLEFTLPERGEPQADWTPTHITLPAVRG